MKAMLQTWLNAANDWLFQEHHRQCTRDIGRKFCIAFTTHPEETGETYLQHLWFTTRMAARFIYTTIVLLIHGLFPFLLQRAASTQIEAMYRIMKTRIPKSRRDQIDIDYCV